MRVDPLEKLQHLLQTLAFGLAIAALQVGFEPDKPFAPIAAYSLAISVVTWSIIDLGRHVLPSSRETGWPTGIQSIVLVIFGIGAGWFLGNQIGTVLCRTFGLLPPGPPPDPVRDLRNSILITLAAASVAIYWFYSRNRSDYLERKMGEAQRHANEARLKLLETQLEPHMLFNTLANLRALIGVDPQRAQQMLDHMIAYLRATLDASRVATHPLQAEFDRLRDYLELMAVRMGPRLAFQLQLPPELSQRRVPTLLLQPLVENAIKHGLEPQVQGGQLNVRAADDGDRLLLEVCDTGTGPGDAATAGSGFGLLQVRERLAAVYGEGADLDLAAVQPRGTRVAIHLPLSAT
ncbi:sensor histidine kinase [Ramlibacter sp. MMS24-I3-19]|uniref:sensor histidine kinase n=1 Tax=Ramlibacter sp. MMS24-I3-19 TaxID=3416606 RepID=UPI003D021650